MERRRYERSLIDTDALIYHQQDKPTWCHAKNIGANGVFILSDVVKLQPNMKIQLEFSILNRRVKQRYRIPARVVYSVKNGMGVKFVNPTSAEYLLPDILLNEIRQQQRPSYKSQAV